MTLEPERQSHVRREGNSPFNVTFLVGNIIEDFVDFRRFSNGHFDRMTVLQPIGDHACSEVIREKLCPDVVGRVDVINS